MSSNKANSKFDILPSNNNQRLWIFKVDQAFLIAIVGVALCIGGAYDKWPLSHLLLQGISLAYVAFAFIRGSAFINIAWPVQVVLFSLLALPIFQILPLPAYIVDKLPGREISASIASLSGISQYWRPISLQPMATLSSFVALWPALAVFIAVHQLPQDKRELVLAWLSVVIMAVMTLAVFQFLSRSESMALHDISYRGKGMGTFRNYNHMAISIVAWMPVATLLIFKLRVSLKLRSLFAMVALCIMFAVVLATTSRAGLGLATMMVTAITVFCVGQRSKRAALIVLFGFAILAVVIGTLGAGGQLGVVLSRFADDSIATDLRWPIIQQSLYLANIFWPIGSGGGSFEAVYSTFEPLSLLVAEQINAAHNDYVQITMEYGLPGCILVVTALCWLGTRGLSILRDSSAMHCVPLASLGAVIGFLLHSLVDYPLRTPACMVLFAMFTAIVSSFGREIQTPGSFSNNST